MYRCLSPLRSWKNQQGAGLLEFAIVLPLFILILVGIAQFGRQFSEINWYSTVAYETALAGSQIGDQNGYGSELMRSRYNQLYDIHTQNGNTRMKEARADNLEDYLYEDGDSPYDANARTVTLDSTGVAQSVLENGVFPISLDFNMSYVAALLFSNPSLDTGDLSEFANDPDCYYGCDGQCQSTPPIFPCGDSNNPPPGDSGGGFTCFAPGTPISLANGMQLPIEKLQVGDLVLSYDVDSGRQAAGRVIRTMSGESHSYFLLNDSIKVTAEHPFFVDGEWRPVKDLKPGDSLLTVTGNQIQLASKEEVREEIQIHNITVEGYHNYYAAGILVHNKSLVTAPEGLF